MKEDKTDVSFVVLLLSKNALFPPSSFLHATPVWRLLTSWWRCTPGSGEVFPSILPAYENSLKLREPRTGSGCKAVMGGATPTLTRLRRSLVLSCSNVV